MSSQLFQLYLESFHSSPNASTRRVLNDFYEEFNQKEFFLRLKTNEGKTPEEELNKMKEEITQIHQELTAFDYERLKLAGLFIPSGAALGWGAAKIASNLPMVRKLKGPATQRRFFRYSKVLFMGYFMFEGFALSTLLAADRALLLNEQSVIGQQAREALKNENPQHPLLKIFQKQTGTEEMPK